MLVMAYNEKTEEKKKGVNAQASPLPPKYCPFYNFHRSELLVEYVASTGSRDGMGSRKVGFWSRCGVIFKQHNLLVSPSFAKPMSKAPLCSRRRGQGAAAEFPVMLLFTSFATSTDPDT
jgi:hypothetical protein